MSLRSERQAIADGFTTAGIRGYAYVPSAVSGTSAIVQPGSPYLSDQDQPYGSYRTQHTVLLMVANGTNEKMADDLDEVIESAIAAFQISEISEPFIVSLNGSDFYAVNATVVGSIRITG